MSLRLAYLTVFVIAACGLGYELVAGSVASYLLGDTVTQFSTAIGLYLSGLGVGAWLSKFVKDRVARTFVDVESAVALLGGTSAAVLYLSFARGGVFHVVLWTEILVIGTLVGLEIPLLLRLLKDELEFKDLVAQVLTFDYIGSLAVSLAFPLLFVPRLGLVRTALLLGLLNGLVALWSTWIFRARLESPAGARLRAGAVCAALAAGFAAADKVTDLTETRTYGDEIVLAKSTPYQRIVVTQGRSGFQLWLNGSLQFASADEHRYHESLVHPAMAIVPDARRVLVLGGGDGLAVREVLRHPQVERVTLVDIDPEMTALARDFPPLARQNGGALSDPRVEVVNDDAFRWLAERRGPYDVIVADFPDPGSFGLGKLYTTRMYERVLAALAPDGAVAVQSTSPFFARKAFWCIARTMEASGMHVRPYRSAVPSFGEWGYVLGSRRAFEAPEGPLPAGLRHLDGPSMRAMFALPPDVGPVEVEVNRLDNQSLVRYYEEEWRRWN
ncbi:MAG: Polyamine aminopropyltransferase [Planctomycetes bacterium]|nr:Polyamine aminopropyltransferase [Planctomycetota bacterium]